MILLKAPTLRVFPVLGAALIASWLLAACEERIVYVYPDGSAPAPADASPAADSGTVRDDASAPPADAWTPPPGACMPHRTADAISHADCRRYADRPVCDPGLDDDPLGTCVVPPTMYCAPCESDAQCAGGVDLRAECVFIPHPTREVLNDQACLSPCESDVDCAFLNDSGIWLWTARCTDLPRGRYCTAPFSDGTGTCSDFMGGRREDGE